MSQGGYMSNFDQEPQYIPKDYYRPRKTIIENESSEDYLSSRSSNR